MRIIYRDFLGRKIVREFSDWREMCVWLKRLYPLLKAAEEAGDFLSSI